MRTQQKTWLAVLAAGVCSAGLLAMTSGCAGTANSTVDSANDNQAKPVFHLITHGMPGDPFWAQVQRGWAVACKQFGIDGRYIGVRQDGNVGEMLANLETVVATGSDGIACVISDQETLERPLRQAIDTDVPVIAVNIKDLRDDETRIPYLVYVGEGSYETGAASARAVLEEFRDRTGRVPKQATFINHAVSLQCLEERGRGMKDVYEDAGTKFTVVATTFDPSRVQENLRAYLEANPDVEAFHGGASQVAHWAVDILKQMGRIANVNEEFKPGTVFVGGIDMDKQLLEDVKAGDAVATIDQQPYLQGYYAAQLLDQYRKHRLVPSRDILTGPYVVDQANAQQRIEQLETLRSSN